MNKDTAFVWRHKILDALQNMVDSVKLSGIIEGDETFFRYRTRETTRKVSL